MSSAVVKRPAPIPRWFWFASMLGCTPGFKRSRCKKLLKVTMSRIKLLRSRREVQVRQLRRDVAQLLQLGQEENAESRLDRLWKEQSLLSAYMKTGEYCQLVKANLSNIALPRECPMDLKEPIASLCFAASCCADLPELKELREIMAMKYGNDFVRSAHELLPGTHVNRMFLEAFATKEQSEMSRKALLKGIIKEYNVVQPRKSKPLPADDIQKRKPRDAHVPYTDSQHHGPSALEKEQKRQSGRQIKVAASKSTQEDLDGKQAHNVEAMKAGQRKQGLKKLDGQPEEGATESSYRMFVTTSPHDKGRRDMSRPSDHKRDSVKDQVGEGEQRSSIKQKSKMKGLQAESGVLHGLHGHCEGLLPQEVEIRGHPTSELRGRIHGMGRGQQHEQPHGEEKPGYGKFRLEEALHDFEKPHYEREVTHSDVHHVKKSSKGHSKSKGRLKPADECDNVQRDTSSHGHHGPMFHEASSSGVPSEFEFQHPPTRGNGFLPKRRDPEKVQRARKHFSKIDVQETAESEGAALRAYPNTQEVKKERKYSSKNSLHDTAEIEATIVEVSCTDPQTVHREKKHSSKNIVHEPAEIETAEVGAYLSPHGSQRARKKLTKTDTQEEVGTDFREHPPFDEAASVCPVHYQNYLTDTARQRAETLHRVEDHASEAGAKTKTEAPENHRPINPHESAFEHTLDAEHALGDQRIYGTERLSRRTRKHKFDCGNSSNNILNRKSISDEPMQKMNPTEKNANKESSSLAVRTEGSSTHASERTVRERGLSTSWRESERGIYAAEDKKVLHGYGVHQEEEKKQHVIWDDDKEDSAEVMKQTRSQAGKDSSPLPASSFSKPPDRPPPPVPPYRLNSLPNGQPYNRPAILPQRCVSLETSQIRSIQEPHVHPKLPEYEDLVASFAALRSRVNSSSSS